MMNFLLAQAPGDPPPQPLPHPELPEVFLPPAPPPAWIYVAGLVALIALLALVLWLLLRPRQPGLPEPKRPWKKAMRALKELSSHARGLQPAEVSAQVSEILRRYFLERYKIPAPFQTTQEIFQEGGGSKLQQKVHKYASLATLWDQLSFAPAPVSEEESMELLAKAMTALEEDHPVQTADVAAEEKVEIPLPPLHTAGLGIRKLSFGMAVFFFVLAAGSLMVPFVQAKAQEVWWIFALMAVFLAFVGYRYYRSAQTTDPRQKEYGLDPDASLEEQIRYYHRRLILTPLFAIPFTAWIIYDMERLTSGEVEKVRVWAPVALIYDLFGYWGAVLVVPVFALFGILTTLSRLKVLKLHQSHQSQKPE